MAGHIRGLWTSISDGRKSFVAEAQRAVEVESEWIVDRQQCDIILDFLPGWLEFLWGSDEHWLYARRPEGIWKTKIPEGANLGLLTLLYQKGVAGTVVGGLSLGSATLGVGGWIIGAAVETRCEAGDLDDFSSAKYRGVDAPVDEIGPNLIKVIQDEPNRMLIHAKDSFERPPAYCFKGGWLIATDGRSGRKVAYEMNADCAGYEAMLNRRLWLRYGSKWMKSFDVHVDVNVV